MKKEILIIGAIILCLGAYLLFHKENRDHYTLPQVEKVDTRTITAIAIEKKDGRVRLDRSGEAWTVTDQHFPADSGHVETLMDTLKTFRLTALVTEKQADLNRYSLDEAGRIKVVFYVKDKAVFTFFVGKEAPTYNHTFVMLETTGPVYHAMGNFRNDYTLDAQALRDKKILEIKPDSVRTLTVEKGEKRLSVTRVETKDAEGKPVQSWKRADKKKADPDQIKSFLASLSYLKCDAYVDTPARKTVEALKPLVRVSLDAGKPVTFSLYRMAGKKRTLGISSMNDYLFSLSDFDAKKILENSGRILGEAPPAP